MRALELQDANHHRASQRTVAWIALGLALAAVIVWVVGSRSGAHDVVALAPGEPTAAPLVEAPHLRRSPVARDTEDARASESRETEQRPSDFEAMVDRTAEEAGEYWEILRVQAISRSSLRPIAGAQARLDVLPEPEHWAYSDENGCLAIWAPIQGHYVLSVQASGYALHSLDRSEIERDLAAGGCGYKFFVPDGATVRGCVVDDHGQPVTEGEVFAYDWRGEAAIGDPRERGNYLSRIEWRYGCPSPLTYTARGRLSSEGCFEIEHAVAGEPVHLLVESPRALRQFQPPLELEQGEVREVRLVVATAACIRGKVVFPALPEGSSIVKQGVLFTDTGARGNTQWSRISDGGQYDSGPLFPAEAYELMFELRVSDGPGSPPRFLYDTHRVALPAEATVVFDVDLGHLIY